MDIDNGYTDESPGPSIREMMYDPDATKKWLATKDDIIENPFNVDLYSQGLMKNYGGALDVRLPPWVLALQDTPIFDELCEKYKKQLLAYYAGETFPHELMKCPPGCYGQFDVCKFKED